MGAAGCYAAARYPTFGRSGKQTGVPGPYRLGIRLRNVRICAIRAVLPLCAKYLSPTLYPKALGMRELVDVARDVVLPAVDAVFREGEVSAIHLDLEETSGRSVSLLLTAKGETFVTK